MFNYFIPTASNNYRAKLLSTPVLVIIAITVFLFNTVTGVVPVAKVHATISTQELLDLHNQERAKAGLQQLSINVALTNSAQAKAQAMLESDCWSHYCPNGKSPWDFFNSAGYVYLYAGENLAEGFFNNEDVMVAWMNSPTHRENIIKPEYTEVGFGVVIGTFQGKENNVIIVAHFGTPQPVRNAAAVTPTTSGVQTPEITAPKDGSAFNTHNVTITGRAPGASTVEIRRNGARWITANPVEGIFTYNATDLSEQSYQLIAVSHNGDQDSQPSTAVNFQVDVTPDPINIKQLMVASLTAKDELNLHVNSTTLSHVYITLGGSRIDFTKVNDSLWTGLISRSLFLNNQQFTLGDADEAGNEWSSQVDSATILIQTQNLPVDSADPQVLGKVISASTKAEVNGAFLVILAILFAADFVILSRTGVTRKDFKSHLHFAVFAIIAIIAVSGLISGQVGIGLSSLT